MRFKVCVLILVAVGTVPSGAVEKDWCAHEAELTVVGRYRPAISFPWIDGWHTRAEIEIEEVLYGDSGGRKRIVWEAVTPWEYVDLIATLRDYPPPQLLERHIWALRQSSQLNKWNSCFGPRWWARTQSPTWTTSATTTAEESTRPTKPQRPAEPQPTSCQSCTQTRVPTG
ncbi:hypothetical protein F183_A29200 [Bryobacterales bacterium F-183]|nr:hypothetical protein F183_A29200 [Bryobacterales bacterium F-183]